MKVALIYDRVNKWGGAERILLALHEIWPEAPLYTAVYNPQTAPWAKKFKVIPSFLNKFPPARARHEAYPYLMPLVFESFNFEEYDVVISIVSEAAKGIITKPKTLHVCYCLTPTRYLWSGYEDYFQNKALRVLGRPIVAYLRQWDKIAAQRPDFYLATCKNVKKRIKRYYQRDSEVIYPPIDINKFKSPVTHHRSDSYFLLVSRLVAYYKKVDLAVKAFNQLEIPLKIIGGGIQKRRLEKMAKGNIEFLGQLTERELLGYYENCQAVVVPQEEDFGLVPLEAQACGKPVIAYRGGGALETVIEGQTGTFFYPQSVKALVKTIRSFKPGSFKPTDSRQNAAKFNQAVFKKRIKQFIEGQWKRRN